MIGAVNQHAGDTGRSHFANRYFFGSLHRGWLLDGKHNSPARCQTPEVRAGPAELKRGANQFGWDDNTMDGQRAGIAFA
jgi:hypothetical protein